ncbi:MAG: protein-glutamate O-methyltransferase CheR [Pseudomonadota bacterium]
MTDAVFASISDVVQREAGIILQESKRLMIASRVAKRLKALNINTFEEYCEYLSRQGGEGEKDELIGVLTTNVTNFFREKHHFEDFEKHVIPDLMTRARAGLRVRIWSAGCSIGAEPYSIALTLLNAWPSCMEADVKVLATDIDPESLAIAKRGVYPQDMVHKEVPNEHLRHFQPTDDSHLTVSEDVRSLVSIRPLNLIKPWPMRGRFSVIFCRNVVIYFGQETTNRVWMNFADRLEPGGRLYIGHSERVKGAAEAVLEPCGVTAYRLTEGMTP